MKNTWKKVLMVWTTWFAVTAQVNSMTVNWDGGNQNAGLTLSDQTTGLPVGSLVLLGNFNGLSDSAVMAFGANIVAITNAFQAWGSITIGTGADGNVGVFYGQLDSPGSGYFNELAYIVAFNAGTIGAATEVGVFKGISAVGDNGDAWIFPANDDPSSPPTFAISDLSAANVLIGSYGVGTFDSDWMGENANALALIPEPSSAMLVGTALFGAFLMRRRKV